MIPRQIERLLSVAWRWMLLLPLAGCSLFRSAPAPTTLATSVQSLAPHGDRDHFVFVWERVASNRVLASGLQVEHVNALAAPEEFEITLSEDGVPSGRVHIRDSGTAISVLGEDDLLRGIRMTYDPPLPYLESPLLAGKHKANTTAHVTALVDGQQIGTLAVKQVTEFSPAPPITTSVGTFAAPIRVETKRSIEGAAEPIDVRTKLLLGAGVGEIQSEVGAGGEVLLRRRLACAIIGGRARGNCQAAGESPNGFERAPPTLGR